jgi:two-component system response regulator GlrR
MNDMPHKLLIDLENGLSPSDANRILVVDDDPEVARAIALVLHHLGYESVQCSHAQEALSHIQSQKFDLVLTDYRMPDMTGLDLVSKLRQDECSVPIIMMTGYSATAGRVAPEKLGVFAILKKPITAPQLARTVKECIEGFAQEIRGLSREAAGGNAANG